MSDDNPVEPPPPSPSPPLPQTTAPPAAQTNTPALISFITALLVLPLIPAFGIGFAGPIVAIVTGHIGLARAKTLPPAQSRRWMALTGLILGYLYLAFFLLVAGLFLIVSLTSNQAP